jgi:hypothetical protein
MENQDKQQKQGVVPATELQGSDADKAYDKRGNIPALDKDETDRAEDDQSGSDADEAEGSVTKP